MAQVPTTISYQGRIQSGATPFTGNGHFKFAIVSTGTNTSRQAAAFATVNNGFLTVITVTSSGGHYDSPPTVTITDPTGSGATVTANLGNRGGVVSVTVNNAGHNYSNPTVTIAPPPPAYAYATYWSNDGTSIGGSQPIDEVLVPVQQGLFMLALGDTNLANMQPITPMVFQNPNTFLRIWVSDGTIGLVPLTPDQPLASTAYAMVAGQVLGSVQSPIGEPLVFKAGGTEAMRIDAAGNLGLGVTTPAARLDLAGDVNLRSTNGYSEGFESFFFPPSGWSSAGNAAWVHTTSTAAEGATSVASGAILDNQSSSFQLVISLPTPGLLTFDWKVSSEFNFDFLTLCINGNCVEQISGNVDWTEITVPVGAGLQTLVWRYSKDRSVTGGADTGWIDNIRISQGGSLVAEGDIRAPKGIFSQNVSVGTSSAITTPGTALDVNGAIGVYQGAKTLNAGMATEVGADLINFGLNDGPFNRFGGSYTGTSQGGFLRVDSRAGTLFTFNGRPAGSTADTAQLGSISAEGTVRFEIGPGEKFSLGGNGDFEIDAFGVIGGRFVVLNNGNVGIGNAAPSSKLQVVNATCNGTTWANASDRNLKEHFAKVNAAEILDRVLGLSVTEWNYKDAPNERHVGPVAQDFHAAFGLGSSDKHITTVDADGVALAAIQGLNQKLEAELRAKSETIKQLEERLNRLEKLVDPSLRHSRNFER